MNSSKVFGHALSAAAIFGFAFCATVNDSAAAEHNPKGKMQLTSTAFNEGGLIPLKYTCDGANVSPALQWTGTPAETKSLVLIGDDPDAPVGTWVHWVVYDLPPSAVELAENVGRGQYTPTGGKQGLNDFNHLGYGGPCPPPGKPHRYFFKLYALGVELSLKPSATKRDVERAMEKHILAEGKLMGTYKRG